MFTLFGVLLPPLVASSVAAFVRPYQRFVGWVGVSCAAISFVAAAALCVQVASGGPVVDPDRTTGLWWADSLSALVALCISFVTLLASALAPGLVQHDVEERSGAGQRGPASGATIMSGVQGSPRVREERSGAGQAGSPTRQPRWGAQRGPASGATIMSGAGAPTARTVRGGVAVQGSPRVREEDGSQTRRLRFYMSAFAFTMLMAVTVQNVALMWIAIEATTIASALAIPLNRTKASVEASWKYLLVCSVGIALAFTGTILAYFDFVATAGEVPGSLNWTVLRAAAPSLHPELLQLAFAFILVGYGTKAGLAPMHTWLPDAHSEAPSPISAMMSGVLLAVAMYAIARWKAVIDGSVDPAFTNGLLIGFGLLSVAIGTFSLVIQRHYKRMLAYSSVEHMGLVTIGLALGPLGAFAAWLHVVNHAIAKSASFLLAGRILHRYETTEIDRVSGLLKVMPWTGALFAAGILALIGLPPFGLFVSEFLLVQAAVVGGKMWLAGLMLLLLLMAFVSLLSHLNRMLYGGIPEGVRVGERRSWPIVALLVPAAVLIVLGVTLPRPISTLIHQSVGNLIR